MKRNTITLIALLLISGAMDAHDFAVTQNHQNIYFSIIDEDAKTAVVTYSGSIGNYQPSACAGELEIPSKVRYRDVVYTIVGIGPKAFSGADKLTGVILPETIEKIGDFAFEGCTSLKKIVFPSNPVEFGQGTFFKCDKIQEVSLGNNWPEVNLQLFRWSDSLRSITIPAKVEKIKDMKRLKCLQEMNVDSSNTRFTSIAGILYNKNAEILYGCPRAYDKSVEVPEGTKRIYQGAFIDCKNIETVDLPESLHAMSFREFSRMKGIKAIIFRKQTPFLNAKGSDEQFYFLLQVANPEIKVVVPKKGMKEYQKVLAKQTGEYYEMEDVKPYFVDENFILKANNITSLEKFIKQ